MVLRVLCDHNDKLRREILAKIDELNKETFVSSVTSAEITLEISSDATGNQELLKLIIGSLYEPCNRACSVIETNFVVR